MKPTEYNIYIDESGDEGLNRGSNYFILTAIIVKKKDDLKISKVIDVIKEELQISKNSQLHWNKVKGIPNKKMIIDMISKQNITIINIVIDTRETKFIPTKDMYYHFIGYLFERICGFLRYKKGLGNIKISSRGQLFKKDLINYLMVHNKEKKINFNRLRLDIEHVKIYPNSQKRLLQMADCCCTSLGQALNYNDEKSCDIYMPLINKCYSYKGKIINTGLKFVHQHCVPKKWILLKKITIEEEILIVN